MRSSERFPAILASEEMTRSLAWLVCSSTNPYWRELKRKNNRTNRLIGSWVGDNIEVIGDENEEDLSHFAKSNFEDISFEIVACLFDFDKCYLDEAIKQLIEWPSLLEQLGVLMLLKDPPEGLEERLASLYPNGWMHEFDRICSSKHIDPRHKLRNPDEQNVGPKADLHGSRNG